VALIVVPEILIANKLRCGVRGSDGSSLSTERVEILENWHAQNFALAVLVTVLKGLDLRWTIYMIWPAIFWQTFSFVGYSFQDFN
jgi:hypothetical protein